MIDIRSKKVHPQIAVYTNVGHARKASQMRELPTAREAALLIALSMKRKKDELRKDLVRNRFSEKSLGLITGRRRLDQRFISDLSELLLDFNLLLIDTGKALGLLQASSVMGWPRLTSKRITAEIKQARSGELNFRRIENELEESRTTPDEEQDFEE
jgi:hypothetical protein